MDRSGQVRRGLERVVKVVQGRPFAMYGRVQVERTGDVPDTATISPAQSAIHHL
ncbi:hypothetical protein Heshes_21910 [Alicyclobacillus hesperidum]|uniref:Uncharacterized protein n=1 Tax=Alicyclobacillus hesperidum TaxID=89784 RepID=A0AA37TZG0_9BACL|nr:hypothetical protein Heshes_21910 [Alicyclobacillus hesperidum]